MKPVDFKEQTKVLQKPASMTSEECSPLSIWNGDEKCCISCWKANIKERIRFLFTGKAWLRVHSGNTQPPVYIGIDSPFARGVK